MTPKIMLFQPFFEEFDEARNAIREAGRAAGADVHRLDEVMEAGSITERAYEEIEHADLIVCDLTTTNSNVMYRLGYAHALKKPIVLVAQRSEQKRMPFDLRSVRTLYYDPRALREFTERLAPVLTDALRDPEPFRTRPSTVKAQGTVFVSYSHRDSSFLGRLQVHLKPLEREGLLELWDDTRLGAGDQWKQLIAEALARASVAVLLITADFLASDFIINTELPELLSKAREEGTRVIPIVLKPCRFLRDKVLTEFQAINRIPLVALSEGEQEEVYDQVSRAIEDTLRTQVPSNPRMEGTRRRNT
jgi:hypothetical protein